MLRNFVVGYGFVLACLASTLGFADSPDVVLNDVRGKPHHFNEYIGRGHWTVLTVWGPRCPPCVEEMPELQTFHDAHKNGKAIVLGVAVDFPSFGQAHRDEVEKFAQDYLISFPLLLGDSESFTRFGGAELTGVPTTVIYDRKGAIVARHVGSISRDMIERFIAKWDTEATK